MRRIIVTIVLASSVLGGCWFPFADPMESVAPSTSITPAPVTVPLDANHAVVVSIDDLSGLLIGAKPALLAVGTVIPAGYAATNIAAWNPSGKPNPDVLVYWGGVICDTASSLVIGPQAATVQVDEGPVRLCDASNDGRGLLLTFSMPVDATKLKTTFVTSQQAP